MKKLLAQCILFLVAGSFNAQVTGDTIKIKTFKYGSTTRDTLINFPSGNLSYEKIIMRYNMRCKNNLVSTQSAPNQGCGEWDYSCNTYIVDSSKIENALFTHPSHIISNHSGNSFPYTALPVYDYYSFGQTSVTLNNVISETQYTLGTGTTAAPNVLKSNEVSGRSQLLFTAAELTSAGLAAGNIDGFILSVANAGGGVNFLRVGLKASIATVLASGTADTTGFTRVYNSNYNFVAGNNRIQFYSPFVWNGTSNVIVDLSFTNTNPGNPVIFNGNTSTGVMALYTKNNYALDLSALGHVILNANNLASINNEITVTFWAYGQASALPANTTLLYGYGSNINQRNINLHFPWSDNNMYFDCGYSNGGFDRINKVATAAEQGGRWNHWAVTKNANTGDMMIYLNGVLWHSGTAKTNPMSILNLILGKNNNLADNWKGKLNELTIWNKELSATDIAGWMNKSINNTHPFYANLVAYYKLDEGTGLTINETKNNITSTGVNLQWTYDRGNRLARNFAETTIRPNLVFVKGTYAMTTTTVLVMDSVKRNPNFVMQYSVVSNASVTPVIHDQVVLVSTNTLYAATPRKIFNGETGLQTGTLAVLPQNTIAITSMNYYNRYPFYNEIMSFVTPYGKGLDLGPKGKTWYYDVTDFTPVLKGPKRMLMSLGGENQEQMDIDFWFIVGTPPQNVLNFNQLWQGAARANGASIASINNDTRFPVQTLQMLANGQAFKMRSTITGHGAQGEFKANGGTINHFLNVNGGANEFTWQITEECAGNVIFPQGGTWVYDREGWCPGQTSLTKEFNLTPHVTPGSTVTLDYGCSNPPNPSGDYRYIVANQLITYGAANHSNDARILDVLKPSDKVLYSRVNPVCANPVILVQNSGSTALTNLEIEYWINNSPSKETYTWTGNLAFLDTAIITLPINNLWLYGTQTTGNVFYAEIKKANMAVDQYSFNNVYRSPFSTPIVITNSFTIEFKTNLNYLDNSYVLTDDQGNIAGSSNFTGPNVVHSDYFELNGCYNLKVEDAGHDGLSWWANTGQGTGYVRLKNAAGTIIKTFQPDFGKGFEFSFSTYNPSSINTYEFGSRLNLYPNPARDKFMLEGDELENANVEVTDLLGHKLNVPFTNNKNKIEYYTGNLVPGMYLVNISNGSHSVVKKVMVN